MNCSDWQGPEPCSGTVAEHAITGDFIERYACETHLFMSGECGWERLRQQEQSANRQLKAMLEREQ